jgi:glycosyltransferase involved in cell wall biosynthesis
VIVPTFRRPQALATCLRSLARMVYPKDRCEVIVVDDGGGEPLGPVVDALGGELAIELLWQPNRGPAAARNTGAKHAQGQLFAFIDDDCLAHRDWLSILARYHAEDAGRIFGGRVINALSNNLYAATSQILIDLVYGRCNADPMRATFLTSNNLAVPAAAFDALGGFDPRFRTAEDRELCDRWLFRGGQMTYLPDAVVFHANPLSLGAFWRQHFRYGRGASAYHRVRHERGSGNMRYSIGFHSDVRKWLLQPFARTSPGRATAIAGLLLVMEVANAVGFCAERLRRSEDRSR